MSARKKGIRLIVISAAALALVLGGIQFINAQQIKTHVKPVKPEPIEEVQWKVSVEEIFDGNATVWGEETFESGEYNEVMIYEPDRKGTHYGFYLRISPGFPGLDFSGVTIMNYVQGVGDPCGFPPTECSAGAADCVACFMNNNLHPAEGYNSILLRFHLLAEALDNISLNTPTKISDPGYLHISFYSEYGYEPVPPGETGYHNLYSFTTIDSLWVTRRTNGWEIEFNQALEDLTEEYTEEYIYTVRNKEKVGTRLVQPLIVTTNPLHFKMIWTQY